MTSSLLRGLGRKFSATEGGGLGVTAVGVGGAGGEPEDVVGGGDWRPSNLAVLLDTNQARTTFSVSFNFAANTFRSEDIGYSSLMKAASKVDSIIGSRVDFDS